MRSSHFAWRSGGSQWPVLGIALAALGVLGTACGGSTPSAAPTPAATVAVSPAAVASPARPPLASPVAGASPSPGAASPSASPAPAAPAAGGQSYTVQAGDTLGKIAQEFYGDQTLWRRIYDANKAAIGDDPDALKLETKLTIPPKP